MRSSDFAWVVGNHIPVPGGNTSRPPGLLLLAGPGASGCAPARDAASASRPRQGFTAQTIVLVTASFCRPSVRLSVAPQNLLSFFAPLRGSRPARQLLNSVRQTIQAHRFDDVDVPERPSTIPEVDERRQLGAQVSRLVRAHRGPGTVARVTRSAVDRAATRGRRP
jgi:hypothetical protein